MAFLAPAALALAALALPIILLYMLRLRRREQPISSALLWRELVRDRAANAPWQRLRRNLLLLLQLLILAALVLALARPYLSAPGPIGGGAIVLLDASASMSATDGDGGATRFAEAVAEVDRLINGLSGGDRLTLIQVGRAPTVLAAASNDRGLLRRALASAAVEYGPADWPAAFALTAGSTQGLSDPRIVIVSDGGLPESLPALPGEVSFAPVGRAGDNLAIAAQAARAASDGTAGAELLVAISNPGPTERQGLVSLYVDGALYDSRRVAVAAGGRENLTWPAPAGAGVVETRLEPADGLSDYLAVDNQAWTVLESGQTRRVLLVGEGNLFLERFFAVLPGYELFRASEAEFLERDATAEAFDLVVLDSVPLPEPLPAGNLLVFNPQPSPAPLLQVTGSFTDTVNVRLADTPLLENVAWRAVSIAEAQRVEATALETLVAAEGGPLLLAGEPDGRRVAVFTFDLRRSDLPLQIAFPVIMANIVAWLSPGRAVADEALQPGATVTVIPDARAEAVVIARPDGSIWEQPIDGAGGALRFADTRQPGIYTVAFRDAAGATQPAGRFAVNFFDAEESAIQPAASIRVGQVEVTPDAAGAAGRRELWPWLLLAGLALLLAEWWVSYRRAAGRPRFKFR